MDEGEVELEFDDEEVSTGTSDNQQSIPNEKTFRDLNKLEIQMNENEKYLEELNGKDVMILMGISGTGKSTLANALI